MDGAARQNYTSWLYRKSSIKGLFISSPFEAGGGAGLNRYGGLISEGGLFNLDTTMVSVLHKKTRIQSGKAQVQKVLGHAAEDQNQIRASSW